MVFYRPIEELENTYIYIYMLVNSWDDNLFNSTISGLGQKHTRAQVYYWRTGPLWILHTLKSTMGVEQWQRTIENDRRKSDLNGNKWSNLWVRKGKEFITELHIIRPQPPNFTSSFVLFFVATGDRDRFVYSSERMVTNAKIYVYLYIYIMRVKKMMTFLGGVVNGCIRLSRIKISRFNIIITRKIIEAETRWGLTGYAMTSFCFG